MAQLWIDCPEQWVDPTNYNTITASLESVYQEVAGGNVARYATGRFGRNVLQSVNYPLNVSKVFNDPAVSSPYFYIGMAMRPAAAFNWDISLQGPGGAILLYAIGDSNGTVMLKRGQVGTVWAQSVLAMVPNTWYFVELGGYLHASSGWAEIRVNGEMWCHYDGNTTLQGSAYVQAKWGVHLSSAFQDFYANDGSGDDNNTWRGDSRVDAHFVNAAGDLAEWTASAGSNYQCVDEKPNASTADYNEAADVDLTDLYNIESLVNAGGLIHGIAVWLLASKTDSGACEIRHKLKLGTTEYQHPVSKYPSQGSYQYFPVQYDTNPDSGSPPDPFSESAFNAMQVGADRVA